MCCYKYVDSYTLSVYGPTVYTVYYTVYTVGPYTELHMQIYTVYIDLDN
jgi:hypothetical protein